MLKPSVQVHDVDGILLAEFWECLRLDPAPTLELRELYDRHVKAKGRPFVVVDLAGLPEASAAPSPLAALVLADLRAALEGFAVPPAPPAETPAQATEHAPAHSGFFDADALTNPDHVRYALKTTAAAMFCYLLSALAFCAACWVAAAQAVVDPPQMTAALSPR